MSKTEGEWGWKDVVQDELASHCNSRRHQENALPAAGRNPAEMRGTFLNVLLMVPKRWTL